MGALGICGQKRWRGTMWTLCLLFLVTFPVACRATVQEGNALVAVMHKWKVNFVSWTAGRDPCQGQVPWEYVNCTGSAVTSLLLANKGLQGPIPLEIGQLTSLTFLDLGNLDGQGNTNSITGEIPNEFSLLTQLQILNLTSNPLRTEFPTVLLNMVNLQYLQMDHANLTGAIPENVQRLQNLVLLYLGDNELTGALPAGLSKLSKLQNLSLWQNDFTTTLPSEWGELQSLTYLNLHDCSLHGGLPTTWSNLRNLKSLNMKNNVITGHIPDSWTSLTSLQELHLQQNFISGALPSWIFALPDLRIFDIKQNQLQSSLPTPLPIGNMESVNLQCNFFNGTQPNISGPLNASILQWNCFLNVDNINDNSRRNCQRDLDCLKFPKTLGDGECPGCPVQGPRGQTPDPLTCVCEDKTPSPTSKDSSSLVGAITGGVLGFFLVVVTATVAFFFWKRRWLNRKADVFSTAGTKHDIESLPWEAPKDVRRYSYDELAKATDRFSDDHVIGAGGFGKVFYGRLVDGKKVAIKKASDSSNQGRSEFRNEVALLSRLHHRHLVRLEGFCEESGKQILVYEFMPNGNLQEYISGKREANFLTSYKRLEIAVEVAQGLDYLHSFANPPVIHRDVKPSNILLDDNFVAKVADFGISKATPEYDTHISTRPAGTAGFLDPEYFISRQLTTASDVYGFGVVLLELITGQQAINHSREQFNLIQWSRPKFEYGGIKSIIDPLIEDDFSVKAYTAMAEIALRCASFNKDRRPSMKTVLTVLEALLEYPPSARESLPKGKFKGSFKQGNVRRPYDVQQESSSDGATVPSFSVTSESETDIVASLLPR